MGGSQVYVGGAGSQRVSTEVSLEDASLLGKSGCGGLIKTDRAKIQRMKQPDGCWK